MSVKTKLIGSLEVKSPSRIKHFKIYEGEIEIIDLVVNFSCRDGKELFDKTVIEAIDSRKELITWKVIEGHLLELYNSFTIIT
uniref:Bet v I/Major latex protein domain-containing protein n=1 Tax=Solanum lycopersicum TaxID=4081 RepID=A0A3Q7GHK0_SOLLC